jgi:hypothetical protein
VPHDPRVTYFLLAFSRSCVNAGELLPTSDDAEEPLGDPENTIIRFEDNFMAGVLFCIYVAAQCSYERARVLPHQPHQRDIGKGRSVLWVDVVTE